MPTNRVILAHESRLLRGLLRRVIARAPGLQVGGESADLAEVPAPVDGREARWIIVSLWPGELIPRRIWSLVGAQPALCVLGLAADGSRLKVVCNGSSAEVREAPSLADLLTVLRREVDEFGYTRIS